MECSLRRDAFAERIQRSLRGSSEIAGDIGKRECRVGCEREADGFVWHNLSKQCRPDYTTGEWRGIKIAHADTLRLEYTASLSGP